MTIQASLPLRVVYCLTILGVILPFGLAKSSWVGLATGGGLLGVGSLVSFLTLLAVGLYRIYSVSRTPETLAAPATPGLNSALRAIGATLLYAGAVVTLLGWVVGPLMRAFMTSRSDSGAEYFVVGLVLAVVGNAGVLGLVLFEFSRLTAFERQLSRVA